MPEIFVEGVSELLDRPIKLIWCQFLNEGEKGQLFKNNQDLNNNL